MTAKTKHYINIAVTLVLLGIPVAVWITSAQTGKPVSSLFFGVFLVLFLFGIGFLVRLVYRWLALTSKYGSRQK